MAEKAQWARGVDYDLVIVFVMIRLKIDAAGLSPFCGKFNTVVTDF
jgi:hypothetical protein